MFGLGVLPTCSGHRTDTTDGWDFDCDAVHGDSCENCLANYHTCGGLIDPNTGRKLSKFEAFIRFGKQERKITYGDHMRYEHG